MTPPGRAEMGGARRASPPAAPAASPVAPPRPRASRLAVAVLIQLGFLGVILFTSACYTPSAKLTAFDVLSLPGKPIALRAKIETDGPGLFNPDLKGVELEFLGAPAAAQGQGGEAPTARDPREGPRPEAPALGFKASGADGFVEVDAVAPSAPGLYSYWVRARGQPQLKLREPAALLTVAVIDAQQPVLITDIDGTICSTRASRLSRILADQAEEVEPLPDAAAVLAQAARKDAIIYLTARSTYLAHRTKRWLAAHGFPAGPVLMRDLRAQWTSLNFSEKDFKEKVIRDEVKPRWPTVLWGIGNTEGDAWAYAENGVRAVILDGAETLIPARQRDLVKSVRDWNEVKSLILP